MFKNIKIRTKLLVVTLAASFIPFLVIGATALWKSHNVISRQAFNQLESVREIKKTQIDNFFTDARHDIAVLLEMVSISRQNAFQKLQTVQESKKAQLESYFQERVLDLNAFVENDTVSLALEQFTEAWQKDNHQKGNAWQAVFNKFGKTLSQFKDKQGYYELWLITKEGQIVYTVAQGDELRQNVLTGNLKESPLRKVFQTALKGKNLIIQDFELYIPADNQYLAFLTTPITRAGEIMGVLALGLSAEAINKLIQRREGMGNTEETYVVGELNGRTSYRSDRVFKWQNRQAMGHDISGTDIDDALAGHSNVAVKTDSNGNLELGAYAPLQIAGLHWCLITAIALDEVITPKLATEQIDFFTKYIGHKGYSDLLLIHASGKIFYSVKHEADYGTNILNGK